MEAPCFWDQINVILAMHCTENHIFFFQTSWKDGFSKTNRAGIWFLLYYQERWYFFFPKIWSYTLDGKWKMIFLKKNTLKYDIFFKRSEKMVFSKRAAQGHDLSCIIWKDGIFSRKHDIFSLGRRSETTLLKKYMEIWYFLSTRMGITNVVSRPSAKKIKDGLIPQKCSRLTS